MRLVLLLCALITFSALTFIPAEAQGSWTCNWDFSNGVPAGWTLNDGTITGSGVQARNTGSIYLAKVTWPATTTITSVTVTYTKAATSTEVWYSSGTLQVHTGNFPKTATSATRSGTGSASGGYWQLEGTRETPLYISSFEAEGTGTNPCPAPTPTPIPSSTPIIINTFATPTAIAIDAGGIYGALTDSNADVVNLPPSLINVGRPPVESGSQIFAYVKWIVSPSSADEIAGPFAPIISHTGIFLSLTFVMMTVYAIIWGVVWLLRFIVWIFKFIVMLVDLVLQVAQAIGGIIGGIIKFFL